MFPRVRYQVIRLSDGGLTVLSTHRKKIVCYLVLWFFILSGIKKVDHFQYLKYDIRRIKI